MLLKFYGVRGSIPAPLLPNNYKAKITEILKLSSLKDLSSDEKVSSFINKLPTHLSNIYGGNTSCIYISDGETHLIFDAGSGIVKLGHDLEGVDKINLFFSHTHLDHINGLPLFTPLLDSNNSIDFYSIHADLEKVLSNQQKSYFFPKEFKDTASKKKFIKLDEGKAITIGNLEINSIRLNHPNGSYAYKILDKKSNKSIVYATDGQYEVKTDLNRFYDFYKDVDVLIFDAQYTDAELINKIDYGHSSASIGIDIARKANVKKIFLFHMDFFADEKMIDTILNNAIEYDNSTYGYKNHPKLEILVANEDIEMNL